MSRSEKSSWGPGAWHDEPDHVAFDHAGLSCILHRNHGGAWCGYAAVAPGHPVHGQDYNDINVDVHGGLTYADKCQGSICHVAKPGEPDDVWWFGFDCSHPGDYSPAYDKPGCYDSDSRYRDIGYVTAETKRLAEQLAAQS